MARARAGRRAARRALAPDPVRKGSGAVRFVLVRPRRPSRRSLQGEDRPAGARRSPRPRRGGRAAGPARRPVRRETRQCDGRSGGAAHGPSGRHGRTPRGRGNRRCTRRGRGPGAVPRLRRGGPLRPVRRAGRGALHRRRPYRDRRLPPRPGDDGPGPAAGPRRAAHPLRLQRGRGGPRGRHRPARSGSYPRPRRLQDLHHPGDHDERAVRAPVARRGGRRPCRDPHGRDLLQRPGGRRLRHRGGPGVRVPGLGRRPLLAVVGHRPARGGRGRGGPVPGAAGRRRGHGPALPLRLRSNGTCRC